MDENLSERIISQIAHLFPGSTHVNTVGLREADDRAVWELIAFLTCCLIHACSTVRKLGSLIQQVFGWTHHRYPKPVRRLGAPVQSQQTTD